MTEAENKIVGELTAAAQLRHECPIVVEPDEAGLKIWKLHDGRRAGDDLLEEYLWNSGRNMLIRIGYIVWEHIIGEDHEWGRFNTKRQAEQRIAALFSPGSLGKGEYYITRLYTTRPIE